MPDSQPPENKSGAAIYIAGVLLLGGGIAAIVLLSGDDKPAPTPPTVAKTAEAPIVAAPPPPPPPPPTATESASAAPEESAAPSATGTGKALAGGTGACSKCGEGVSNSGLNSALQGAAGSARGCYNRVVQKNQGAAGKMNVAVQVGANGQVCSAAITNDSVGNGEVSSCVLSRFQGKSFPKPDKGCVTVNIPLSFTVKE